jgi:TPR repeat protein
MAHDVFISYSAKNKTTADAVCVMLESNGIRCWIAPRDVIPGMEWGECIIDAIEQSRIMVLVFTAAANDSPQIRREVERAVNHGVAILPLRIEDVMPGRALEYFIGNVHWLDALTPPLEAHLKNLAGTIKMLLARMEPQSAGPVQLAAAVGASKESSATEKARLEQEEEERQTAELRLEAEERQRHAASEKARLEQEELERLAAIERARLELEKGEGRATAEEKPTCEQIGQATPPTSHWRLWIALGGGVGIVVIIALLIWYGRGKPTPSETPASTIPAADSLSVEEMVRRGQASYGAKDYPQALQWYRKSAAQGNLLAENNLGYMYQNGLGVQTDYAQALQWYRKSTAQGNSLAENNLGYMYQNGFGVKKDEAQAQRWYQKAKADGYKE